MWSASSENDHADTMAGRQVLVGHSCFLKMLPCLSLHFFTLPDGLYSDCLITDQEREAEGQKQEGRGKVAVSVGRDRGTDLPGAASLYPRTSPSAENLRVPWLVKGWAVLPVRSGHCHADEQGFQAFPGPVGDRVRR